jgi:hypothetical protein
MLTYLLKPERISTLFNIPQAAIAEEMRISVLIYWLITLKEN